MRQLAVWKACQPIYVEVVGEWKPARGEYDLPSVEVRLVMWKRGEESVLWRDGSNCAIPVDWLEPIGRMARELMRPRRKKPRRKRWKKPRRKRWKKYYRDTGI